MTSNDYFRVTLPAQFLFDTQRTQVVAYFDHDPSYQVTLLSQVLTIYPPQTKSILANTLYSLSITTLNGPKGLGGLTYPV